MSEDVEREVAEFAGSFEPLPEGKFNDLIESTRPVLMRVVRKFSKNEADQEDLVQEAIVRALRARHQFRPGTNFAGWMTTIVRNVFLSRHRVANRVVGDPDGLKTASLVETIGADSDLNVQEIRSAISELPYIHRDTLRALMESGSYEEMARRMDVPVGTAKSRVNRAREALREHLDRTNEHARTSIPLLASAQGVTLQGLPTRSILPVPMPPEQKPASLTNELPVTEWVDPLDLMVEESYQRGLASTKSQFLIRKIVRTWDWTKFKPPICARSEGQLYVIDGQHTATAAATHPGIDRIPVLVVPAESLRIRAAAFVSHNSARVPITPYDLYYAAIAEGNPAILAMNRIIESEGCMVPRYPISRANAHKYRGGLKIMGISKAREAHSAHGDAAFRRLLRVARDGGLHALGSSLVSGLMGFLVHEELYGRHDDATIAATLRQIPNLEAEAKRIEILRGTGRVESIAITILEKMRPPLAEAGE